MATEADRSQSRDFPLPADSTQNPIRADYPRKVVVLDGDWEPCTDARILAGMDYLAVSYRQSDFPDKRALEKMVKKVCIETGIRAYWLDFACTGETPEEKNEDLYRIADVFRNAKLTLILIIGEDGQPLSDGWESWGMRIWTFPEALLSQNFIVQVGLSNLSIKDMTLNQVANHAYGSDNVRQRMLVQLYSNKGKDFSEIPERFEMLCEAMWGRHSGSDSSAARSSSALTAYPGEKVYALMGFLLHRIQPRPTESEDEAFHRLLFANELQCNQPPSIAYASGGTRKLSIRNKKDASAKESYVLPNHVPEARFDYNRDRRTCEEGTRMETLAKIFRWLGLDGHRDQNDSSLNAESQTDVLTDVLWLKGLAGSGKSTIAQTAAEKCHFKRILGASFFCSRSTKERSNSLNIFTTISYLLCQLDKDFKREVSKIYGNDKDLQRAEPDHQLKWLIVEPLKAAHQFRPCVIIIDALDECSDINTRSKILAALDKYVAELKPLKFLITSRPDHDINVAFRTLSLGDDTEKINLDKVDPKLTDRDLRIVLTKGLINVRQEYYIPDTWPSEDVISILVAQAQQLFIFVSTALKFIGDPSTADPCGRLDLLLKSRTIISKSSPYTYLDNLYREVFRTAFSDMEEELKNKVQMILGILILGYEQFSISKLADFMEMRPWTVRSTLSKLHALVVVPENNHESLRLIHSSIHDFLIDKNRCTDSRFVVDKAVGHSTIARCCFRTLARFAESEEMQPLLQALTKRRVTSVWESFEGNEYSVIKYSCAHWDDHIKDSNLNEDMMKDLEGLVSNQRKFLLTQYFGSAAEALLGCIRKLPKQPSSSSDLPSILYQSIVFLLGEKWSNNGYIDTKDLWKVLVTLCTEYGYKSGLFGLNERTVDLEVAIASLQNFVPEKDVPEMDAIIHRLKRAAEEVHNKILQQTIPEDEKLCSDLMVLMSKLYRQLRDVVSENRDLNGDSNDYAIKLEVYLFAVLYPMEAFNEIFDCCLNNNFDNFLTGKFVHAFSTADDKQLNVLRAILTVGLLGPKLLSFADMEGLQSLFCASTDQIFTNLSAKLIFVCVLVDDIAQIKLIYPMLFSTFFDSTKCLNICFFIDPIVEHSKIALCSVEKLSQFMSTPEMQSYQTSPSVRNWNILRDNLRQGNDTALTYAYRYWLFHMDKTDGQLDELVIQHLGELLSKLCLLDALVSDYDEVISVFLNLFNKILYRPSLPFNIRKQLYEAVIFLCSNNWPRYIQVIEKQVESIKDARVALKTNFSYKDGLYSIDLNFPFLPIIILNLSNFCPYMDVPEIENNICELRNHANGVHELIMLQTDLEDESVHSVLQECMTTLHEELKSSFETYSRDRYSSKEKHAQALHTALPAWITSLNNFRTKVHDILGIQNNIEPLDSTIIDVPEQNGPQMSATISNEDHNYGMPVMRTSCNNAGECTSASSSSFRPARLLLTIPPASGHSESELVQDESLIENDTSYNSPNTTFPDVSAVDDRDANDMEHFPVVSASAKHPRSSPTDSSDWKRPRTD